MNRRVYVRNGILIDDSHRFHAKLRHLRLPLLNGSSFNPHSPAYLETVMLDRNKRILQNLQRKLCLRQPQGSVEPKQPVPRAVPRSLGSPSDFQTKSRRRELIRRAVSPSRLTPTAGFSKLLLPESPKQQSAQTQADFPELPEWEGPIFHTMAI